MRWDQSMRVARWSCRLRSVKEFWLEKKDRELRLKRWCIVLSLVGLNLLDAFSESCQLTEIIPLFEYQNCSGLRVYVPLLT